MTPPALPARGATGCWVHSPRNAASSAPVRGHYAVTSRGFWAEHLQGSACTPNDLISVLGKKVERHACHAQTYLQDRISLGFPGIEAGPLHRTSQKGARKNVRVQPDPERFLDWPIELADNCLAPVQHRRNVGGIDFPVFHALESTDFSRLSAFDSLHILRFARVATVLVLIPCTRRPGKSAARHRTLAFSG